MLGVTGCLPQGSGYASVRPSVRRSVIVPRSEVQRCVAVHPSIYPSVYLSLCSAAQCSAALPYLVCPVVGVLGRVALGGGNVVGVYVYGALDQQTRRGAHRSSSIIHTTHPLSTHTQTKNHPHRFDRPPPLVCPNNQHPNGLSFLLHHATLSTHPALPVLDLLQHLLRRRLVPCHVHHRRAQCERDLGGFFGGEGGGWGVRWDEWGGRQQQQHAAAAAAATY